MTTVSHPETARPTYARRDRFRRALRGPALWRVTAAISAAIFAVVLFFAAPGSVSVIKYAPNAGGAPASALPAWARPCLVNRYPSLSEPQLAFCARADGRVVGFVSKDDGEAHLLVAGGFHLTLVELKPHTPRPSWGSRIVAVGPLSSTDGLRELEAQRLVTR